MKIPKGNPNKKEEEEDVSKTFLSVFKIFIRFSQIRGLDIEVLTKVFAGVEMTSAANQQKKLKLAIDLGDLNSKLKEFKHILDVLERDKGVRTEQRKRLG